MPDRLRSFAVAWLALTLAGCGHAADGGDTTTCADGKCDSAPAATIPGPELARCWIERGTEADPADKLTCTVRAIDKLPIALGPVVIAGTSAKSSMGQATFTKPETPQVVFSVLGSEYPIKVSALLPIDRTDQVSATAGPLLGPKQLRLDFQVDGPDAFTADAPRVLSAPWSYWPVTLIGKEIFVGTLDPTGLDVSPFTTDSTFATDHLPLPLLRDGQQISFFIAVAPDAKQLTGAATFAAGGQGKHQSLFALAGAGAYVVESGVLRPARPDELAPSPSPSATPNPTP
jgi:hypothetical protein